MDEETLQEEGFMPEAVNNQYAELERNKKGSVVLAAPLYSSETEMTPEEKAWAQKAKKNLQ